MQHHTCYSLAAILTLSVLLGGCGTNHQTPHVETTVQAEESAKPALPQTEAFVLEKTNFQKNVSFPGELSPYEEVDVYPKIEGFIQQVLVDRGSKVHQGQLLATLVAPELEAKIAEAQSKVKAADAADAEANAKFLSEQGVYNRLHEAAQTPGVISENELATAQMSVQAAKAHVQALQGARLASVANVNSLREIKSYLQIRSPINGVVTERDLHPGALVGPSGAGASEPIVKIQQIGHLRLMVSIPERFYSGVNLGMQIPFTVAAYPDRTFSAIVSRLAYALDEKNRTETVELDVNNSGLALSPGMYAEVSWPMARKQATFMVPNSAIVSTTERTFVERVQNGVVGWVDVKKGFTDGDRTEVFGNLQPGDQLIFKGSDEYRDGAPMQIKLASSEGK